MNETATSSDSAKGATVHLGQGVSKTPLFFLFECRRYKKGGEGDAWAGALLIVADDEADAKKVFEDCEKEPCMEIVRMQGVYAVGPNRILYNDYVR